MLMRIRPRKRAGDRGKNTPLCKAFICGVTLIDAERHDFREAYLSRSDTMVDYLHLEIVARLAHEDEKLLGAEYPGPMV